MDYIFPTPIHYYDVQEFGDIKNELIDYAYDLKKRKPISLNYSNQGGWHSPLFSLNPKEGPLHTIIIDCIKDLPTLKKSIKLLCSAWININKPGDYNTKHVHPNCNLSGVFWIKTPENCGNIEFDNPTYFQDYELINVCTDEFRDSCNRHHSFCYKPIEGRILIFPSHLQHHVNKNKSNEDRISFSFNIKLC